MTSWRTVLLATLLLLLTDSVYTQRTRSKTNDHPEQTRARPHREPWLPVGVVQASQRPSSTSSRNPWVAQQVVTRQGTRRHLNRRQSWEPQVVQQTQQTQLHFPQDSWLPETQQVPIQFPETQQTQVPIQFPQQRPVSTGDCWLDYDEVPDRHIHPMLVRKDKKGFLYPDLVGVARVLQLASGTSFMASCPGEGNKIHVNSERSYVYLKCRNGILWYGKKPVTWAEMGCLKKPKPILKQGKRCGRGSRIRIIGWYIRRGMFLPQITLCFNRRLEGARFTSHQIHGRYIDAKIVDPSRPSFKTGRMFTLSVQQSYTKRKQKSLVQGLLNSTEHLTAQGQHYLAKGHLAPDADFVLEPEQDATYYYANAVPQWQAVNNGNWKAMECSIRQLAEDRGTTLDIWTGSHGILQLPHRNDNPIDLYLGLSYDKEVVPVPALLWKVIYDPATHSAIALVMVNDVRGHGTSDSWSLREPPCPNLCRLLQWVDWDTSDLQHGMTFCCDVNSLRRTIPDIPSLVYDSFLS